MRMARVLAGRFLCVEPLVQRWADSGEREEPDQHRQAARNASGGELANLLA